jgi:tRNA A37 methylthiotransferase MiaB
MPARRTVALVTLGCARNDVDSEELAGRLADDGWQLVHDAADADVALVNTCGFVEAAKKDSVDALLEAAELKDGGRTRAVVAVGCLAERYGTELAEALPEPTPSWGSTATPTSRPGSSRSSRATVQPHTCPSDRRCCSPSRRSTARRSSPPVRPTCPWASRPPAAAPRPRRLGDGPVAPLKLASGCDRRCTFCAIPSFRGCLRVAPAADVLTEARWLAGKACASSAREREHTSYGKDLGDLRLLETLLPELAAVLGITRVRLSYLQPAEVGRAWSTC